MIGRKEAIRSLEWDLEKKEPAHPGHSRFVICGIV